MKLAVLFMYIVIYILSDNYDYMVNQQFTMLNETLNVADCWFIQSVSEKHLL